MNDLILKQDTNVDMWHNEQQLQEIKNVYAKGATDTEFKTFTGIGKATGLNPFLREIWLVKYNGKEASIFIGRDGYRKTANRDKNYVRHHVEAIYDKDEFHYDVNTGKVHHKYNFADRGKLFGAYCLVFMKNSDVPYYRMVQLDEYDLNQSVWQKKKPTMIMKVAECQCLRMACPELFGGTYDETEKEHIDQSKESSREIANQRIDAAIVSKDENSKEFIEVNKIIRNAEKLSDLDSVPDLVKQMKDVNNEVQTIRQLYKSKRDKLKQKEQKESENVNEETGEIIDVSETDVVELPSEYQKIKKQLEKAKSVDTLDIAGDLIRTLPDGEQRDELSAYYSEARQGMKG